jgi:hypothetical protein
MTRTVRWRSRITRPLIGTAALLLSSGTRAQLPLNIEQLLVEPARWQLTTAVDVFTASMPGSVQRRVTGWRSGLRYGIAPGIEVNASWQLAETRLRLPVATVQTDNQRLAAGVNWLVKPETTTPALLLELRGELARRDSGKRRALSAGQVMLTAYQSIDPVVLSLTVLWDHRRSYRRGDEHVDPGSGWRIEPAVNFAVNPRVTLLGGLSVSHSAAARINRRKAGPAAEQVALRTGVGFALNQESRVFLSGDFAPSADASGVTLQWFYDF